MLRDDPASLKHLSAAKLRLLESIWTEKPDTDLRQYMDRATLFVLVLAGPVALIAAALR